MLAVVLASTGLSLRAATVRSTRPLARWGSLSMADNDQGVAYPVRKSEAEWKEEVQMLCGSQTPTGLRTSF